MLCGSRGEVRHGAVALTRYGAHEAGVVGVLAAQIVVQFVALGFVFLRAVQLERELLILVYDLLLKLFEGGAEQDMAVVRRGQHVGGRAVLEVE